MKEVSKRRTSQKEKEQAVLAAIVSYKKEHGYVPNFRELAAMTGIRSISTISGVLDRLEARAMIKRDRSRSRGITLLKDSRQDTVDASAAKDDYFDSSFFLSGRDNSHAIFPLVDIPVIGTVAAGQPILAEQEVTETIPLPSSAFGRDGMFLLRIRGDSMIGIGICDGDYVAVKPAQTADNGDIVVALIENEATVKRFYKEDGRYRLQPENPAMEPIYADHVAVQGIVTDVIHHF